MKSISDLPWNLIEEILSRVPITSLRAIASTCKRWNTLSKDQIFTERHCGKAAKEFLLNMTYDDHEYDESDFPPARFNLQNTKELPSSLKKIGNFLTPVDIADVYQCDGLLLLVTTTATLGLVVWNPYLGHTRWIEHKNSYRRYDGYAIGYDNKKNHKVLRVFKEFQNVKQEIYDFNSNSWRVLDITSDRSFTRGVSSKGNTYFGPRLHLTVDFDGDDVTLSCVREEQLAVFVHICSEAKYEMEIWITTKIEPNEVSWTKFFKVDIQMGRNYNFLLQFEAHSFFIDKEKKVAVVCGRDSDSFCLDTSIIVGEDGYFEKTVLGVGDVFSYIPSSMQIK